jgi:glucose/arabinose dehydrogenase
VSKLLYFPVMSPLVRSAATLAAGVLLAAAAWACGGEDQDEIPFGLQTETVASANRVSEIAFAPDGRIFFAEQYTGAIRIIGADGRLQPDPFAQIAVQNYLDLDWGLTGLALHPQFAENGYVYAFYTRPAVPEFAPQEPEAEPAPEGEAQPEGEQPAPEGQAPTEGEETPEGAQPRPLPAPGQQPQTPVLQVPEEMEEPTPQAPPQPGPYGQPTLVRFTDVNGRGEDETVITDRFPITPGGRAGYNGNGRIHFGPDGYLYMSIGDYDEPALVQNLTTPVGKLLRIDPGTGEAPPDNPFAGDEAVDQRIFAYGFREPFDFAFHPQTGEIYGTDNTPVSCEELNIIRPGENHGWPDVGAFPYADCNAGAGVKPMHHFSREGTEPGDFLSFVEVSGLAFAPGSRYPALGDSLFVCESQRSVVNDTVSPGALRRLVLAAPAFDSVTSSDRIVRDCKGAVRTAPDGAAYYANATEIRRLLSGPQEGGEADEAPGARPQD